MGLQLAWATGTVTDYRDALIKLRDFATDLIPSPTSGLPYVMERNVALVGSEYEMIFRGVIPTSPERNLWFGVQTYSNPLNDEYGWDIRGFSSYADTSPETAFTSQPGISPGGSYLPLSNKEMTYWFVGDERHLKGFFRAGTTYHPFFMGFLNIFGTDDDYPYPLCVSGTSFTQRPYYENDPAFAGLPHPAAGTYLRWTDGLWYLFRNFFNAPNETQVTDRGIWPLMEDNFAQLDPNHSTQSNRSFNQLRSNFNANPAYLLYPTPGACPVLFPLTLLMYVPAVNVVGEMPGLYWVSGQDVAPEDIIEDNTVSPRQRYVIFKNIWRTDAHMFGAMRIE